MIRQKSLVLVTTAFGICSRMKTELATCVHARTLLLKRGTTGPVQENTSVELGIQETDPIVLSVGLPSSH